MMVSRKAGGGKGPKKPSSVKKAYLLLYNGVLTLGWTFLLVKTIQYTLTHWQNFNGYVPHLYDEIRWPLQVFQTAALLEIFHSMVGIVPSGVMTTMMQVSSRVFITWALIGGVPGVSDNPGLLLVAYAWGITEVVRYSYYVFSLLGEVPYIIKWCRYTFFYILYPLGIVGEMMLYFSARPVVRARGQWNYSLPNPLNVSFNFHYFLLVTILLYIPLFPQLYVHMIQQRKKTLEEAKPKQE